MDLNLLILGSLLILVLFGVGESIYRKLKLNRLFLIIALSLLIVGLYLPNIKIKGLSVSISGFLLPAILASIYCFKIRSFKIFINFLLTTFTFLVLRMGYSDLEFVPLILGFVLMGLLGIVTGIFSKEIYSLVCGNFFGFVLGNIIYEVIKFNTLANVFSFNSVYLVVVSLVFACVTLYIKLVYKAKITKKNIVVTPLQNS